MIRYLAFLCALLAPALSWGQANVNSSPVGWGPFGTTVSLSVSGSSSTVTLGWIGVSGVPPNGPSSVWVCNTGANTAYVALGKAGVAATTSSFAIPANSGGTPPCALLALNGATTLAGITASSTTTVTAIAGNGSPVALGSSLGGVGAVNSVTGGGTIVCSPTVGIVVCSDAGAAWQAWSPTITCSTGQSGTTFTSSGTFAEGPNRVVTATIHIAVSAFSACTGSFQTTLPVTPAGSTAKVTVCFGAEDNAAGTMGYASWVFVNSIAVMTRYDANAWLPTGTSNVYDFNCAYQGAT